MMDLLELHGIPAGKKGPDKPRRTDWTMTIVLNASKHYGPDRLSLSDVIQSIWQEIAKATYVLVDLTEFNTNVALELGIAHTLGKSTLLVGQGDTVDELFPMISKLRFQTYKDGAELGEIVKTFINTKKWNPFILQNRVMMPLNDEVLLLLAMTKRKTESDPD